jgi:Fe-S-cluster containining protein
LAQYLTPAELEQYLSLVGEGGWCINYDPEHRRCRIYEDRPRFCRVRPDTFAAMFGIGPTEFNEFAITCCEQQIEGVYGPASEELNTYRQGLEP